MQDVRSYKEMIKEDLESVEEGGGGQRAENSPAIMVLP